MDAIQVADLRSLIRTCHGVSIENGWWNGRSAAQRRNDANDVAARLCLIHSEVSEALEIIRAGGPMEMHIKNGKPEGVDVELADVVIRVFDLAAGLDLDLVAALKTKVEYNRRRPHRHGGKRL